MPRLFLFGGPNGAGKTTTAQWLLPQFFEVHEFVNADAIASALSPYRPENVARQAGRLMLNRLDELVRQGEDFAFESTLSSKTFVSFLNECRDHHYEITVVYIWLNDPQLAVQRVAARVRAGGHNIPTETILRRYERGRINFSTLYRPVADSWMVLDNSSATSSQPSLIAEGGREKETLIHDKQKWQHITR